MKKIFAVILFALMFFVCNSPIVTAARHSTNEEISYALNQAVPSLRKTDNYYTVIAKADANFLQTQKQICYSEFNTILAIKNSNVVGGQEATTCLVSAYLILMLRKQFFDNVDGYIQAFYEGDEYKKNYCESKYKECYLKAEQAREWFRRTYGY